MYIVPISQRMCGLPNPKHAPSLVLIFLNIEIIISIIHMINIIKNYRDNNVKYLSLLSLAPIYQID